MINTMRRLLRFSALTALIVLPLVVLGAEGSKTFVSLTDFNGLEELGNSKDGNFEFFLNNLYKLCVGAAAAIAVLQIMVAGLTYMGGDSFTEKKAAKEKITAAILGLLLVLSPVIVFSLINPKILNLSLNLGSIRTNIQNTDLGTAPVGGDTVAPAPTAPGCTAITPNSQIIDDSDNKQAACCASQTSTFYGKNFATCQVQRRTQGASTGYESVAYCGCDIVIGALNYSDYVYLEVRANSTYKREERGVTPKTAKHHEEYSKMCTAAGGTLKQSTESFLGAYRDCTPEKDGLSSEKTMTPGTTGGSSYTQYRCRDMSLQCIEKN
jgi:hypothetical protein